MNFEQVEDFLYSMFGDGLSEGDILIESQDTQVSVTSRDSDTIGDFLSLHGEGSTMLVRLATSAGEIVAITATQSGLPPTGYIAKGSTRVAFWALSEARKIPSDSNFEDLWIPLPGCDSWSLIRDSGDAYSYEELQEVHSVKTLDTSQPVCVAVAKSHLSNNWVNVESTIQDLINTLLNHAEGEKEGSCLLQGRIFEDKGSTRKAAMMMENNIICLDLDNGMTHDEIDLALHKTGYAYLRYTTHSHNAVTTDISKKQYEKFTGGGEVTLSQLREFLQFEKGYTTSISSTASSYEFVAKPDNDYYRVSHNPVSKNRIIFFLKQPFVLRGEGIHSSMPEKWKEKYLGFAESLGISYDRSCTDAARLFYMPRHPKGRTDFEAKFFDGKTVDLHAAASIKPHELRMKSRATKKSLHLGGAESPLAALDAFAGTTNGSELTDLYRWSKRRAFDIVTAIKDYSPDMILDTKAKGGKGVHIVCPNEDMHSKSGGSGTYAVDASSSDDGQFQLHCTHSHCMDLGKFGLLKIMIERGDYFDKEAMTDDAYAPEILIEEEEETPKTPQSTSPPPKSSSEAPTQDKAPLTREERALEKQRKNEEDKKDNKEAIPSLFERMNDEYASVVLNRSLFFIKNVPEAINEAGYIIMNKQAFDLDAGCRYKMKKDGDLKSAVNEWTAWNGHRQYKEMRFDPTFSVDSSVFNTFRGFRSVAAKNGDWSNFKNHLKHALCKDNEEHFNVLMTWLAHIIQRPWEKPGFAVVISGGKGVGKSLIADMICKLVSPYSHTIVQAEQITGKFNSHFDTNLFTVAEEAFFAGDVHADSAIKHLITNVDTISEGKGENVRVKKNYSRLMFLSNEGWVVKADSNHERRYFCFDIPHTFLGTIDEDYFKNIFDEMQLHGGLQAMMYDLQNWVPPFEEGWDILRQAPVTEELRRQQVNSMQMADRFFYELLSDGLQPEENGLQSILLHADRENKIDYNTLYQHFVKNVRRVSKYKSRGDFDSLCVKYLLSTKSSDNMNNVWLNCPSLTELRTVYNRSHQSPLKEMDLAYETLRKPVLVSSKV